MSAPRPTASCEASFKCRACGVCFSYAFEPSEYDHVSEICKRIEAQHAECDQGYEPFGVEDLRAPVPDRLKVKLGPPRFVFVEHRPQDVNAGSS